MQDLNRQRETIVGARDKLHGADANIGKARAILADMTKRIMTNKLIMYGIIGFLVLCIVSKRRRLYQYLSICICLPFEDYVKKIFGRVSNFKVLVPLDYVRTLHNSS